MFLHRGGAGAVHELTPAFSPCFSTEAERVLSALGRVGSHLKQSDDPAVTRELGAHLGRLMALLQNPTFSRLLKIQVS